MNLSLRLTFLAAQTLAKFCDVTWPADPQAAIEGKKFDLMSVDDDRFCFYDQHGPDDMTGGAAVQDFALPYPLRRRELATAIRSTAVMGLSRRLLHKA